MASSNFQLIRGIRDIHLYVALNAENGRTVSDVSTARIKQYMEQRIHEQLSKSDIRDGGFDASELVYALEGVLLLDPDSVSPALLDRISAVIRESQRQTPYWRAVAPFVSLPQGLVLFPISVETANSLLRCCTILGEQSDAEEFFSRNVDLFKRYVDWLRSRRSRGVAKRNGKDVAFEGWHSEHVHLHEGIHIWETSQALLFLMDYAIMLERYVAKRSLESANLKPERPWTLKQRCWHLDYWTEDQRDIGEPLVGLPNEGSRYRVYEQTRRHFIAPRPRPLDHSSAPTEASESTPEPRYERYYSMMLYGPPGTGKTSFAEELCKALRWDLITVTPSDFIWGGESEVEARAKMIFEVLETQVNGVVLFDEVDRMILDRDSDAYGRQSDIFQFMTPSMLTKLRDLRNKKRVIFIVATNYAERIDPAAKRRGRLDMHVLLPPPDFEGRRRIFGRLIDRELKQERGEFVRRSGCRLEKVLQHSRLKVFGELKQIFDDARGAIPEEKRLAGGEAYVDALVEALEKSAGGSAPAAITLRSYASRFPSSSGNDEDAGGGEMSDRAKYPYDEFMILLYLCLEKGGRLDEGDKKFADEIMSEFAGEKQGWSVMSDDDKRKVLKQPMVKALGGDESLVECILGDLYRAEK